MSSQIVDLRTHEEIVAQWREQKHRILLDEGRNFKKEFTAMHKQRYYELTRSGFAGGDPYATQGHIPESNR